MLLDEVEKGVCFVITYKGRPIARLIPHHLNEATST
jgi:antitoxin (DNA-binding transcriptional repressor) of toxin-antitoxin stability system